jgi:membrane associated rhomboid family serine protease
MAGITSDIKQLYQRSDIASRFVLINVGVFLLLKIILFIQWGTGMQQWDLVRWFALESSLEAFSSRPWGILTYMFVHEGFFHILFNMLWLYMAGRIFIDLMGSDRFVKTYWLGGLIGGALYLLMFNLLPALDGKSTYLIGASGSVFAIFIATAAFAPDYEVRLVFIGNVKLKWIALVFVVLNLPNSSGNLGGHLAHFGGALWGYTYARNLKSGKDMAMWFDRWKDQVLGWFKPNPKTVKKAKMKAYRNSSVPPRDDAEFNEWKKAQQEEVDRILDKISKGGYESLTSKEKETLFKASNKDGK